jgi:hypothetical protein
MHRFEQYLNILQLYHENSRFKVLKAEQDAFFHFFSMFLNGAYASKFETGWEP